MAADDFSKQQDVKIQKKLNKMADELPCVCSNYITSISREKTKPTALGYITDLKNFFDFLCKDIFDKDAKDITYEDLATLRQPDVENYLSKISAYDVKNKVSGTKRNIINNDKSLNRKLSSIKSYFRYIYSTGDIPEDYIRLVNHKKDRDEKDPIILEPEQIKALLNTISDDISTVRLSSTQKRFNEINRIRDYAIAITLLGTGIRISELVGINLDDIDFQDYSIKIFRKGKFSDTVYFGDEVAEAIFDYLDIRENIKPLQGSENALFLSLRKSRITQRSVEILIKKYNLRAGTGKNITPHKLRSTYAHNFYDLTKDIMLTKDSLGHKNVRTTMRYVGKQNAEKRRTAAQSMTIKTQDS